MRTLREAVRQRLESTLEPNQPKEHLPSPESDSYDVKVEVERILSELGTRTHVIGRLEDKAREAVLDSLRQLLTLLKTS